MKKNNLLIFKFVLCFYLLASNCYAGPTINGNMDDWNSSNYTLDNNASDFDGTYDTQVFPGWGGQDYDVEKIGAYIDNGYLYIGLQTGFELNYGEFGWYSEAQDDYSTSTTTPYTPGDIALGFGSGTADYAVGDYQFAIRFNFTTNVNNYQSDFTGISIYSINSDSDWKTKAYDSSNNPEPLKFVGNENQKITFNTGDVIANYTRTDGTNNDPLHNTIEAAIKLDTLASSLSALGLTNSSSLQVFWTMSCNNDEARYTQDNISLTPEPETFLLLGFGLIALGGLGRRKLVREDV